MVGSGLKVILVPVFLPALPAFASGALGTPRCVFLLPGEAFRARSRAAAFRQRVHAAHADAVQAARNFVALGIELAAGVQLGHHHLRRRDAFFLVHVHWNAAAVVDHGYGIVDVDGDVDSCRSNRPGLRPPNCPRLRRPGDAGPFSLVEPMYIAGRRRTASRPSSTLMLLES